MSESRVFRYDDGQWEYEGPGEWGGTPRFKAEPPVLTVYPVIKETICGFWIRDDKANNGKRWICRTSSKPYAWPTQERALHSYFMRKSHELFYARSRMQKALYYQTWAKEEKERMKSG